MSDQQQDGERDWRYDRDLPDYDDHRDEAPSEEPDLSEAIAYYSADGQADDESGGDAGAEQFRDPKHPRDPGRTGMPHGPDAS